MSIESQAREGHPYLHHTANALDGIIRTLDIKAEWLAKVCGVCPSAMSQYRTGDRALPAYLVPVIDQHLGRHAMLRILAEMEGCDIVAGEPMQASHGDLTAIIAQHSGSLLAQLIQARQDGVITRAEREAIYPSIQRLIHELQAEAEHFDPRAGNNKATVRPVA